ncbi:proton-coupled folate transporter-like [Schistocerca serialis cubense]|uniref:proton-coupled folate transporter-like n=1 Tax=Schistocerca serialis cubense TaxID=2023355 RepID=UPI00214EA18D|nr:proton-coupled folate transporter-like [Schistocerca serialis cubense]
MDTERKLSVQDDVSGTDQQSAILNDGEQIKSSRKAQWWRVRPTVEPMVLLFMFSTTTVSSFVGALFTERVCRMKDTTGCPDDKRAEAVTLIMYKTIIEAVVPAFVALFIGSWSDKFGRRPIFIWSFLGNTVAYAAWAVQSAVPDLQPEWLLLPSVVASFSGGMMNLMGVANIYIADVAPVDDKAVRLGILDVSQYMGTMLGSGLSAPITAALQYYGVYTMAACLMLACLLYAVFLLPETVPPYTPPEDESCGCCKGIFRPQLVRDALRTCLKKRPHNGRATIFIVIFVVISGMLSLMGESVPSYNLYNDILKWGPADTQLYGFYNNGTTALGTLIGVLVFVRWLRLQDAWIAVITFGCKIVGTILYAIAPDWRFMYIGGAVSCFGGMVWVLARTMLVRLVTMDEIGQVFALVMTLEAIAPLLGSLIYGQVYQATVSTLPGAFYFISVGIFVVDLILLLVASYLTRGAVREENEQRRQRALPPSA